MPRFRKNSGAVPGDKQVSPAAPVHGPRPAPPLSPLQRLRRLLNLSDLCPIDQVITDAAAEIERLREPPRHPPRGSTSANHRY